MSVDLTKYLYVPKQIMDVVAIAIKNLISISICKLNIKNVLRETMGKCIKLVTGQVDVQKIVGQRMDQYKNILIKSHVTMPALIGE